MKKLLFIAWIILSVLGCDREFVNQIELFPVKIGSSKYGYVNREGKIIINPLYKRADVFNEHLALVKPADSTRWGFINTNGQYAVQPLFKAATMFSDGLAWVVRENSFPEAINKNGKTLFMLKGVEKVRFFQDGMAAIATRDSVGNEFWGFADKTGKIKISPIYEAVGNFSEGLCAVKMKDTQWGYIDLEGKVVINYQFDEAGKFDNGRAIVRFENYYGIINRNGKFTVNPQYRQIIHDHDKFLVQNATSGKWGWIDPDGKTLIECAYAQAYPFNGQDLAPVAIGTRFGYINTQGQIVINPQYDKATPFNYEVAFVQENGKIGMINLQGQYIARPQFTDIEPSLFFRLIYNKPVFTEIESDFFDTQKIVNAINYSLSPMNFDSLMQIFSLNKKFFSSHGGWYKLDKDYILDKEVKEYIIFYGNPFDVKVYHGFWDTDYEYLFNPEKNVEAIKYKFRLYGKGKEKKNEIIKSVEARLQKEGYQKDSDNIFTKGNTRIKIGTGNNYVFVKFIFDYTTPDDAEIATETVTEVPLESIDL